MQSPPHRSRYLIPLITTAALVALLVWLASGSSNQPRQPGWHKDWQAVSPFKHPRRAPAAVAYGGFLYVVGGVDGQGRYVRPVEYSAIGDDGQLGPWHDTAPLQQGRFYNAVIAHNGYLYAIGGGTGELGEGNYPLNSVERAKIQADGSLGPWQFEADLGTARRGLKAVIHGNNIYAIGGYSGIFLKSVERATILPDGSLTPWKEEKHKSIIDRYIHSAAIYKDNIYLLGGHMRNPQSTSYGDVEISRVNLNATLQPWQIEPRPLLTSRLVAEAFVLNNYLYMAGGHSGGERLTSVEMSRLKPDGHLGPWKATTPLPTPRSAYAVATNKHRVYVLGGAGHGQPLNTVHMASQGLRGQLGYRSHHP
ncbi:MAG TPA: kelch-like protein [Candidatus Tenderia sp.]|nr:kelch-like protein [Candidatus Tenderia sp.]